MIKVYGKDGCSKCVEINKILTDRGIEFEYIKDEKALMDKAIELRQAGKLIEQVAPIIIKNEKQIKHSEVGEING